MPGDRIDPGAAAPEDRSMTRRRAYAGISRIVLVAALVASAGFGIGPLAHPSPASAGTAETMEATILRLVNVERTQRGLVPLRLHSGLVDLAGELAASMASIDALKHNSCLACVLDSRNIQWYSLSEVIAWTSYPWGDQAAQSIFNAWKGSSGHWAMLMSNKTNYIGIGVAYRSSSGRTYAAAELTESKDRSAAWARMKAATLSGTTVSWTWTGADTALQTHTAGFKNFDVQYRVDGGSWSTIRTSYTLASLSLSGRARGHWYGLRVRGRDNLGLVSGYTGELRIWVP
jgi:uncharacterized protein YkwD